MKKRVLFYWSSGKNSAWILHVLRQQNEFDRSLFDELSDDVDSCGENGEFHRFIFADLLPGIVEGGVDAA